MRLTYLDSDRFVCLDSGVCLAVAHLFESAPGGKYYAYVEHLDGTCHWSTYNPDDGRVLTYLALFDPNASPWRQAIESLPAERRMATAWATDARMGGTA